MKKSPQLIAVLFLVFIFAAVLSNLRAQTSQATLQGQVLSQTSSRPIERALVILRNPETNAQAYRYTNAQGIFYFSSLQPGMYRVRVDALGFQPEERSPVELPVASRIELNFSLQGTGPAATAPTAPAPAAAGANPSNILSVMYGADAAIPSAVLIQLPVSVAETLSGTLSRLVDENKILELPLSGRDVYTLLVLNPGVTSDNATGRGLGLSVNGQPVSSSNFLLDGVDNNDLQVTGAATRVSADAVQEYRMATHNFTADFGRSSGFIANAITRSGTNQFHGSAFEFFNHERLNATSFSNNWQNLPEEPFELHQFGGSLGGPLQRDRIFFFGNFEQFRSHTQSQPQQLFLPSPQAVALAPAGSKARQLFGLFPPPEGTPLATNQAVIQKEYVLPFVQRNNFLLGRADYASPNGSDRLSGRYAFSQNTQDDFAFSPYPNLNAPLVIRGQNLSLNYTRDLLGGTNELKFGMNRNSVRFIRPHPEIPTLSSNDGVLLPGSEAAYDYAFRDTVFHVLDNYNRLVGRHALSLGLEWRPFLHNSLLSPARDGAYGFPSLLNFLFDLPESVIITMNRQTGRPAEDADFRRNYFQNEWAAFVQDHWKLGARLTVNLGVRWELFGAPKPRNGTQDFNFVFGSGATPAERIAGGKMQQAELYRPDRNNFAPRVGFAVDLTGSGRSVLRGSYGIFFDRIFNNFWMDSRSNNLQLRFLANFPGAPPRFQYTLPVRNGIPAASSFEPTSAIAIDQNLRTPYAQSWFVGIQHEIAADTLIELNHTGALGRKLAASDIINRSYARPVTASNFEGRFNSTLPDINFRSNQSHSDNAAMQLAVNRRWRTGLQFQASYTYSRSRDVQSDPFRRKSSERRARLADLSFSIFQSSASFVRQMDPNSDYGYSDFDQRHNLVFNFTAQAPLLRGLPRAMSGWQVSTLAGFRSGFPYSATTRQPVFLDPLDPGSYYYIEPGSGQLLDNRLDFSGSRSSDATLANPTPIAGGVVLLDRAKFKRPDSSTVGSSARNAFRGPGFWNVDLSLARSFALSQLGERVNLQFRLEMFNVFNHTNLNNPDPRFESSTFGEAQYGRQGVGSSLPSASPLNEQPRHVQIALKIYF